MSIFALVTTLASIASLVGLAFQLYQHKERPLTYALLAISILSAVLSSALWTKTQKLEAENTALQSAGNQAVKLLNSWPEPERYDYLAPGEFRGIVISGMAFLEINRHLFPDTYDVARQLLFNELDVAVDAKDKSPFDRRKSLEEAALATRTTIQSLTVNLVP